MNNRYSTRARVLALVSLVALGGCGVFGGKGDDAGRPQIADSSTYEIGVNAYLWRAALDTLNFLPVVDVDSSGGVIITDWYVTPDTAGERLKVSVYILDARLRSDAIKVQVFRQEARAGQWVDAVVRAGPAMKIEDAILTRARELRISQIAN